MSEFRRRLMMESDHIIRLPYVESTGEQCIDTLYKPNPLFIPLLDIPR